MKHFILLDLTAHFEFVYAFNIEPHLNLFKEIIFFILFILPKSFQKT